MRHAASSIPETWMRFAALDETRSAVRQMYHGRTDGGLR
jgi:hypothetical protein